MIILTKLGGKRIMLNEMRIESVIETPDTVITMENGNTFIVSESMDEIAEKCIEFRRSSRRTLRGRENRRADV